MVPEEFIENIKLLQDDVKETAGECHEMRKSKEDGGNSASVLRIKLMTVTRVCNLLERELNDLVFQCQGYNRFVEGKTAAQASKETDEAAA